MKAVTVLACCALVFPLIGTVASSPPKSRAKDLPAAQVAAHRAPTLSLLREGQELFRTGRYQDALHTFERTRDRAIADKIDDLTARAIGNIGSAQFALHQYRLALASFLNAVRSANQAGDASAAAVFNFNIASLYSEMGELDAAAEWTAASLRDLSPKDRRDHEAKLLIQLASLRARQNRMSEARAFFAQGLETADRAGDLSLYANGYNRLGEEYLKQHDLPAAEPPLLEAYRIRKLNHLPLDSSYRNLGLLRMEQGDLESAGVLLDLAVQLAARPQGLMPTWDIYHQRGRVRMAQGRLAEALDDLRIARRLARGWQWNSPAADAARVGAEGWLYKVHSALIEAGNRLYLKTHDPALIRETFEAAEENRASSLRALVATRSDNDPSRLPASYWEALARLQRAEIQALRSDDAGAAGSLASARAEITRMEVEATGAEPPLPERLLDRARAALDADTALLAFHTGETASWLWALDRDGLTLLRLPPRAELESQVESTSAALRTSAGDAEAASARLYQTLFGAIDTRIQRRTRWLIALDGGLFDTPLAALRNDGQYLAEARTLETIPGTGPWLEAAARPRPQPSQLFVGIADAIYNTADPRLSTKAAPAGNAVLLPRLVASAKEMDACSRQWNGERVLLEGASASRENLQSALARDPAVVHLATHVLESGGNAPHGLIALSLTPRRESQLLPPQEIAGWRTGAGVVVMSGCHSAEGPSLPGTGMLGLTRAWLAAGARSVIASNWATPDESGALFRALYRHLAANADLAPAAALRAAQIDMIRSTDWRALPRYWGAYFAVGTR